jgi:hypothetical protein
MNLRHDNLKVVVALLLTSCIAIAGFADFGSTRLCPNVAGAVSSCAASESCCCRRTSGTPRCCCAPKESPPGPTTATNQACDRVLWLSWAQPSPGLASLVPIGLEAPQRGSQLLAPLRPSVMLLLCIWRL